MFAVVHVAVDLYKANHELVGIQLGARLVEYADDTAGPLHAVLERLPGDWRQLTPDEVAEFVAQRPWERTDAWEQMSLF